MSLYDVFRVTYMWTILKWLCDPANCNDRDSGADWSE